MKGSIALRKPHQTARLDFGSSPVTTGAWVEVITSVTYGTSALEIFNPSAATLLIATGSLGNEVAVPYSILPGGSAVVLPVEIKAGARVSVKAVDQTASSNLFVLNLFG